jgi:hypothetical protein
VWIGEKGKLKELTETEAETPADAQDQPTKPKSHKALIQYCSKILASHLKDHESFVTLALALMNTPVISRTDLVHETVATKIITALVEQSPMYPVERLKKFALEFGIKLPDDWDQQISALEGME